MNWLTHEVIRRGGILEIHTEPCRTFDRATGTMSGRGWRNRIVCRDGWSRALSTREEDVLKAELPEAYRAVAHITKAATGEGGPVTASLEASAKDD